jgi:hypothetical protein
MGWFASNNSPPSQHEIPGRSSPPGYAAFSCPNPQRFGRGAASADVNLNNVTLVAPHFSCFCLANLDLNARFSPFQSGRSWWQRTVSKLMYPRDTRRGRPALPLVPPGHRLSQGPGHHLAMTSTPFQAEIRKNASFPRIRNRPRSPQRPVVYPMRNGRIMVQVERAGMIFVGGSRDLPSPFWRGRKEIQHLGQRLGVINSRKVDCFAPAHFPSPTPPHKGEGLDCSSPLPISVPRLQWRDPDRWLPSVSVSPPGSVSSLLPFSGDANCLRQTVPQPSLPLMGRVP